MSTPMNDLLKALGSVNDSLYLLPNNCRANELDDVIAHLAKSLTYVKVFRAWSLGITEDNLRSNITKRMNNYFDDLRKIKVENSDGNINNRTKRKTSKLEHNDFKEICVEAHMINSVSYTRENAKLIMTPMIDIMNDKRIYEKFLPILLSHNGFRTRAWSIIADSGFKELYCRKSKISLLMMTGVADKTRNSWRS
jgi:hypothetical protein